MLFVYMFNIFSCLEMWLYIWVCEWLCKHGFGSYIMTYKRAFFYCERQETLKLKVFLVDSYVSTTILDMFFFFISKTSTIQKNLVCFPYFFRDFLFKFSSYFRIHVLLFLVRSSLFFSFYWISQLSILRNERWQALGAKMEKHIHTSLDYFIQFSKIQNSRKQTVWNVAAEGKQLFRPNKS